MFFDLLTRIKMLIKSLPLLYFVLTDQHSKEVLFAKPYRVNTRISFNGHWERFLVSSPVTWSQTRFANQKKTIVQQPSPPVWGWGWTSIYLHIYNLSRPSNWPCKQLPHRAVNTSWTKWLTEHKLRVSCGWIPFPHPTPPHSAFFQFVHLQINLQPAKVYLSINLLPTEGSTSL